MKLLYSYLILFPLILLTGCKDLKIPKVKGNIKGAAGVTLYLEKITPDGVELIDSALVNESEEFELFSGAKELTYYQLRLGPEIQTYGMGAPMNVIVIISDSSEHITLEASKDDFVRNYSIQGSAESEKFRELMRMSENARESLGNTGKKLRAAADEAERATFTAEFADLQNQLRIQYRNWIKENEGMFVTLQALSMLDPDLNLDLLRETAAVLQNKYPENPYVKRLTDKVSEMESAALGAYARDFTLNSPEGNEVSLYSLLKPGKYLFVDFWASWCKPCRAENVNLTQVYNRFKSKVEFFGVSLDENEMAWKTAIETDQLIWPQASDLQGWNTKPARMFGINAIPANLLLDEKGVIIARNLRGEMLSNKLESLLP